MLNLGHLLRHISRY